MVSKELTIYYKDGKKETYYIDDYGVRDGMLIYNIRFGEEKGLYYQPLINILKYVIN